MLLLFWIFPAFLTTPLHRLFLSIGVECPLFKFIKNEVFVSYSCTGLQLATDDYVMMQQILLLTVCAKCFKGVLVVEASVCQPPSYFMKGKSSRLGVLNSEDPNFSLDFEVTYQKRKVSADS